MKKFGLKKVYLFFSSIVIFILHLPFVFAKVKPINELLPQFVKQTVAVSVDPLLPVTSVVPSKFSLYDSLRLGALGLTRQAYDNALRGFNNLVNAGKIINSNIISIIDFSKPSSEKRLFVIDVKNPAVLFNTYVAHGVNSGREMANQFSNSPESNKSSLGFFETETTYNGKNGYSLHLVGLERGINDNAYDRAIVMHGAEYVNENMIHNLGYIGRSWGCPAVSPKLSKPIIDKIKNGTCLFIYNPDKYYLSHSRMISNDRVG
ncbi:MAG: murein L,D-transpeptidase catalytic domain family protein [Ferruginibacter sp.]